MLAPADLDMDLSIDELLSLPVRHVIQLGGGGRLVTALAFDPAGSRIAVGSADYRLRLHDFNGMRSDLMPFRDLVPQDGYPPVAVSFSPTGGFMLVVTSGAQPKIYDRDGKELG